MAQLLDALYGWALAALRLLASALCELLRIVDEQDAARRLRMDVRAARRGRR